jgi:hypothetical protein
MIYSASVTTTAETACMADGLTPRFNVKGSGSVVKTVMASGTIIMLRGLNTGMAPAPNSFGSVRMRAKIGAR